MFEKGTKEPNDFLAQISEIMQRNNLVFAGQQAPEAAIPAGQVNNFAAMQPIMEAMSVVSKAQLAMKERELELAAVMAERVREKEAAAAQTEQLNTLMNSFNEIKTEKIQILADKSALESKVSTLEAEVTAKEVAEKAAVETAEKTANEAKEVAEKAKADFESEIAKLTADLEAKVVEFEAFKASSVLQGATEVGAGEPAKGEVEATAENLSAEEAAAKIADAEETDEEKVLKEYDRLEANAHEKQGNHVRIFADFCRDNASILGITV